MLQPNSILANLTSPLRLEYLSIPSAAVLFIALSLPVIWLGVRSLGWLGTTRKWVAISLRLSVIWVLVLLLAGVQWVRQNRDLDVIVLRDVSTSTHSVIPPKGKTLSSAIDSLVQADCKSKQPDDRVGIIDFAHDARIAALPEDRLHLDSHPMEAGGDGTDIASAMHLGLASFRPDAMHRLVLISDGNATQGDTDAAITALTSMNVPIDVLPLHYEIRRDVLLDRVIVPTWKRLGEPFTLDVILRSTSASHVTGTLSVNRNNLPLASVRVDLRAGENVVHVQVPASTSPGLSDFRASFSADRAIDDTIAGNDSAQAFTFVRGKGQILYVDNAGVPASPGMSLFEALHSHGIDIPPENHITPAQFPSRLIDLEPYDAIILANTPRGPNGLSLEQDHNLASYVRDLGGGLVVIGGPDSLGPGNWHGSELEKVLPVDCDIPAQRVLRSGALVIVIDHSGSMSEPMPGSSDVTKQQVASESAILAIKALQKDDLVGVVGFSDDPEWVVKLSANRDPDSLADRILAMKSNRRHEHLPGASTSV